MNTDDILHLAKLSRLDLTDEEVAAFPGQIEEILNFVGQIKDADLPEGVVRDMQNYNTLREDTVKEVDPSTDAQGGSSRDRIVAGFPTEKNNMLEVSKILSN